MAAYELGAAKFVPNQLIQESEITITADFPGELTKQGKFKVNRVVNLAAGGTYIIKAGTQFSIYNGRTMMLRGGRRSRTRRVRRYASLTLHRRKHRLRK
jgi:hypothetical protein